MSYDELFIDRNTYSILDWMGDLGGITEALNFFFSWLLLPFTSYAYKSRMMQHLFRYNPSGQKPINLHVEGKDDSNDLKRIFQKTLPLKVVHFCRITCCGKAHSRYKRLLNKGMVRF